VGFVSSFYPIFLRLKNKRCIVVGGGEVAERKAMSLLEHEADVEIVSAAVCPALAQLAAQGKVRYQSRRYRRGDLAESVLAIAATDDPAINSEVADEARERRIPVNVVDNPEMSDFIAPSLLRQGDLSVAISTAGKAPALSRKLRTEMETVYGRSYGLLVDVVAAVRQELKGEGTTVDAATWQASLELEPLINLLGQGLVEEARELLLRRLKGA
jgi:precorrin-2 dehydrogenase/sirohydrochlorin ferrochelatase